MDILKNTTLENPSANEKNENEKLFNFPNLNTKKEKISEEKYLDSWGSDYEEGELSIDVYEDDNNNLIVKSTIAGVKSEDIDISVNNDMLTIRGKRQNEEEINENNFFFRECYWGNFSRTIILPYDVKSDKITAKLKNGVLTIILPKAKIKKIDIKILEEEDAEDKK